MIKMRPSQIKLLAGLVLASPTLALAGTATTNLGVSATVVQACAVTAVPLAFGSYDPTATGALNGTTTITVTCTSGTNYAVGLGPGDNGPSVTARQMRGTTNTAALLNYALYRDTGRTQNWGTAAGATVTGTAAATPAQLTVYGQVPAGQNVVADAYTDTVQVTVTY